jgi:hypothetical protein
MQLLVLGFVLLISGTVLSAVGWWLHNRRIHPLVADDFWAWLLQVVRGNFDQLVGPNSDWGQRIAALGAIVAAIGIVMIVVGIGAMATGKG